MHVVCVTFQITVGKIEEFLPKMHLQARNSIEREPDCYRFDVCQSNTNDNEVLLYEVYTDEAAFVRDKQVATLTLIGPTLPAAWHGGKSRDPTSIRRNLPGTPCLNLARCWWMKSQCSMCCALLNRSGRRRPKPHPASADGLKACFHGPGWRGTALATPRPLGRKPEIAFCPLLRRLRNRTINRRFRSMMRRAGLLRSGTATALAHGPWNLPPRPLHAQKRCAADRCRGRRL